MSANSSDSDFQRADARTRILDAYTDLIVTSGTRAATLDAVASHAGVSKGGLLYHFGSKAKLAQGLCERLDHFTDEDLADLKTHPSGPAERLLRTSGSVDGDYARCWEAVAHLAASDVPEARAAIVRSYASWQQLLEEDGYDPVMAQLIVLVSDGLTLRGQFNMPVTDDEPSDTAATGSGATAISPASSLTTLIERLLRSTT